MASRLEQWLARLDAARDGEASQRLTLCQEALAKAPGAAVARAAGFLRQQEYPGWEHLAVDAFERAYLIELLTRHEGNASRASDEAELDRKNLWALLKKYDLKLESFKP